MTENAEQDMTGMPTHVREAMAAALKLEKQQSDAQPRPTAEPAEPSAVNATAPGDGGQEAGAVADDGAAAPATDEAPEAMKAKIAELEAQVKDQRDRLRRHHGQQRAARSQMEETVTNLQAQIKRLEEAHTAATTPDGEDAVLLRNGFVQAEIDDMTEGEKRRTVKITRKNEEIQHALTSQREDIDRRFLAKESAGRLSAADTAIELQRPGFLAAIKPDAETAADWEVFSAEQNPDSDAGWNWVQTLAHARKVGDRATVLRIADAFASFAGVEFKATVTGSASNGAQMVDIPPRHVMPSSGPAAPASSASSHSDAEPHGQRYPLSYSEEFMARSAPLRGGTFRPFTVSKGGRTRNFPTEKAMERERELLLTAADEGRLDRG